MDNGWLAESDACLCRTFDFKDYKTALSFVNALSEVAEAMNHHPDICFGWGYVKVSLTTHSAGHKVTEKDILLKGKINKIWESFV